MVEAFPSISIIMPNWNGRDYTLRCLDSIAASNYPLDRIEIIIADNGSTDGSVEAIRNKFTVLHQFGFRRLVLITIGYNAGAPAAYNRCMDELSQDSDIVLKIDNDTLLEHNTLSEIASAFHSHPSAGIIGARIVSYSNPEILVHGPGFLHPLMLYGFFKSDKQKNPCFCDFVNGAGMAIRAELIRKYRLRFAEEYFLYWDDTDFCASVKQLGYQVLYWPRAIVRHAISASAGNTTMNPPRAYYYLRGRLLFAIRHGTLIQKMGFLLPYFFFGCHISALRATLSGESERVYVIYRACFDVLTGRLSKQL
jgi:GT2 family glycosyltransferase